ncbi:unnamed protein product, partial [Echinostoma caproni]|uniref:Ig-like domain-containing protein n=1 Tax=Echinostoma caproni TaxID=27848 RepID=A0A183A4I4_9TREM
MCALAFVDFIPASDDMPRQRPSMTFQKTRQIHISVRLKPIIFEKYTTSDRTEIQQVLQSQTVSSVSNAFAFQKTKPKSTQLEGWLSIKYLVRLGIPKGIAKAYLFYTAGSLIHSDPCVTSQSDQLSSEALPKSITDSDIYTEARGTDFVSVHALCAISPKHIGFLFLAANSFDYRTTAVGVETTFFKSVYSALPRWLANENDTNDDPFEVPPSSTVEYQLIKLRVAWRGSVVEKEPMTYFGRLGDQNEGKPMCFYRKTLQSKPQEIDTSNGEFMILKNLEKSSYELIKPSVELRDAGFYLCRVVECATCPGETDTPARQFLVFPRKLSMNLYVSHASFEQNE